MKELDRRKEIELGLGTEGKLRILRILLRSPEEAFTKYQLEKLTRLKPVDVRKALKVLVEIGWIQELPYNPKKYKINLENKVVQELGEFFEKINYL